MDRADDGRVDDLQKIADVDSAVDGIEIPDVSP